MPVEFGGRSYDWVEGWAQLPDLSECRRALPHSAVVVSPRQEVWTYHPARSALVVFDLDGQHLRTLPCPLTEAHGISLVVDDDEELLWLADASGKRSPERDYRPEDGAPSSAVVKVDRRGEVMLSL